MKIHVLSVHEGKKPFKCEICDYSCLEKGSITRHVMLVHEEKKSFESRICDKRFTMKQTMNIQALVYSHLSNKRGAWNKRGGVQKLQNQ